MIRASELLDLCGRALHARLPELREVRICSGVPGRGDIEGLIARMPAALMSVSRIADVSETGLDRSDLFMECRAAFAVRDRQGDSRGAAGLRLASAVADWLPRWWAPSGADADDLPLAIDAADLSGVSDEDKKLIAKLMKDCRPVLFRAGGAVAVLGEGDEGGIAWADIWNGSADNPAVTAIRQGGAVGIDGPYGPLRMAPALAGPARRIEVRNFDRLVAGGNELETALWIVDWRQEFRGGPDAAPVDGCLLPAHVYASFGPDYGEGRAYDETT